MKKLIEELEAMARKLFRNPNANDDTCKGFDHALQIVRAHNPWHEVTELPPVCEQDPYRSIEILILTKDGNIYTGNIRATLASYSLPSSSVKENKRLIEAFGTLIGKRVVLTKAEKLERYALETLNAKLGKRTVYTQASPFEPEPEPEEKKKRTFVLKKKNSAS